MCTTITNNSKTLTLPSGAPLSALAAPAAAADVVPNDLDQSRDHDGSQVASKRAPGEHRTSKSKVPSESTASPPFSYLR